MWSSLISNLRDAFSSSKQSTPLQLSSTPVATEDPFKEEPIWKTLAGSIQDLFFPRKLPPLELTSKPIAVKDPMAVKRGPLSSALSVGAHVLIIGLIVLAIIEARIHARPVIKPVVAENVDIKPFVPITLKMKDSMGGGGGGGARDIVDPSKGRLPKFAKEQITPPQIIRNDHPKLAVEPTIVMPQNIKLPDTNLPNLGVPQSTQVALASQGQGSGSGFGSGHGGGIGSGNGGGVGPGSGGGTGGGVFHVGGGVAAPVLIYSVDPEFSDEARRAKYQGICVVDVVIDAQGNVQHARVVRPLGMGLDEKALEAVRQYRFKPAQYQGHSVPVELSVEVNFRIY